jgi:N-acetylglucosaminyldiphosphoundecaprenol N-acetyl-beta-D-mannosaminyltransferase
MRISLFGVEIDRLDMDQTVVRCATSIDAGGFVQQVSVNAGKAVAMEKDERLREIVRNSGLVNADGQSVVWAARLLRRPLPGRVAGIDLMERLLALAHDRGLRVFVLGAKANVLERAIERLRKRYPGIEIAGYRDGYFADEESAAVCEHIRASRPHILFVAMSSPRKEYWLAEHGPTLGVPFAMGVGGAIDVVAGLTRRAPRWMQRSGLEWLFRLAQEPRRLARRYLLTNAQFVLLVARELLGRRRRPPAGPVERG